MDNLLCSSTVDARQLSLGVAYTDLPTSSVAAVVCEVNLSTGCRGMSGVNVLIHSFLLPLLVNQQTKGNNGARQTRDTTTKT